MAVPKEYIEPFAARGFTLIEEVGAGASGIVFRATQQSLDRDIAVKVFDNPLDPFNTTVNKDTNLRKRFKREAKLLARVVHPSIPVVLTCGEVPIGGQQVPYTAMQLIEGLSLDKILTEKRRLDLPTAVSYTSQILGALTAVHTEKVIHRDVKPGNVLVHPTGHCYLIDFSIGFSLDAPPGQTRVTAENGQPGTHDYMAPEQRTGRDVDQRADLYACGVVLFELLVGHTRINLNTLDADLRDHPAPIRTVIKKACQQKPEARYESAEAFRRALKRFEKDPGAPEQPGTALCVNFKCPDAQWTQNGYYEGPRVIEGTTQSFCDRCGNSLTYPCEQCGKSFSGQHFCGTCGKRNYEVPECKQCTSWLTEKDMGTDTTANGCQKCRKKAAIPAAPPPPDGGGYGAYGGGSDDDIPF